MRCPHFISLFLGLLFLCSATGAEAQGWCWKRKVRKFRRELDAHYRDPDKSPLADADRARFEGLEYFPADKAYCVKARLERTPGSQPFEMPTASGRTKTFRQYGILHFTLKGREFQLSVYQNLKLMQTEKYRDCLFLPFKDRSSGEETYAGGRYIDLEVPKGESLVLDFNRCYNPYCAYSTGWNCPIPPSENFLDVKVLAGVKDWHAGY